MLSNPAKAKRHVDMTHLGHLDKSPPCMVCGKRFKNIEDRFIKKEYKNENYVLKYVAFLVFSFQSEHVLQAN